ncbi:hypothetical protein GCM10010413_09480 [Promicromonospora sukumoe]|uniref:Uncharacterized protein n=1 Tax=Promicromonospora sukumoe TaxID=88382 RepID=A0A7W3J5I2_9MICO|nr:hypothetical protein [Promicromonospora sukumoe]MBA8806618.1 hypothetical protein [Promicromonospora sukumoe]
MTILDILLDWDADRDDGRPGSSWFNGLAESLRRRQTEWLAEVGAVDRLDDGASWVLLSWIEAAATQVVRTRSRSVLDAAVFGMALMTRSDLDWRDVSLVGSLVRRGALLAGLPYEAGVTDVCARTGALGEVAAPRLLRMDSAMPRTYAESGSGETFVFERVSPDFDVDELERWLEGESE